MSIKKITNEIIERSSNPLLPGGVRESYNVCGKPNCQCKHPEDPKPHGPYTQLSYSVSGKSSTISIASKEVPLAKKAIINFKALKSLINELALIHAEEARASGVSSLKQLKPDTAKKIKSDMPESRKLRLLQNSQKKWKSRAHERQRKQERDRIIIRDLTKSRDKWKVKAIEATEVKRELANTERKIIKIEKQLGKKN